MIRQILQLITVAMLFSFCVLAQPGRKTIQKPIRQTAPKVAVSSVRLLDSGCGTEVNCIEVKWNVLTPPANPQVMTFEVSGDLTTANGSCPSSVITINDHNARSAKLGFFQGGACTGQVESGAVTVKLFTRDVEGQKVLASTASQTKTF